jgi:hypothetical protein
MFMFDEDLIALMHIVKPKWKDVHYLKCSELNSSFAIEDQALTKFR